MTLVWLAVGFALSTAPKAPQGEVLVRARDVELGMVMDLSHLPAALRKRAARLPVIVLRGSRDRATVSDRRIIERARAQMPVLASWFPRADNRATTVRLEYSRAHGEAQKPVPTDGCSRAIAEIRSGDIPVAEDFARAACIDVANDHPLRYDRTMGAARALRVIQAGETLAAVPLSMLARVCPGQRLFVSTASGPVRVNREVQAIQASASGRPLFVRSGDGEIFSVPSPEIEP